MADGMILIRTQAVDPALERVADEWHRIGGLPICYVVDERKGRIAVGTAMKVGITQSGCEELGLYCPADFAWRCGDYGLYLARSQFPSVEFFWLIENDVRVAGRRPEALFEKFAETDAELVTSYLEPAHRHWAWNSTVRARDAKPHKCFFPVVRISATAIDLLLSKRREQGRHWARRHAWPNDEGFVGTTLVKAGARILDLNDGEPLVYRADQFAFEPPIDGDGPLASDAEVALFHPVLSGEALARKRRRLAARPAEPRWIGRIRRRTDFRGVAPALTKHMRW